MTTKQPKFEVKCLREYDDEKQRISLAEFETLLKNEKLEMPTMDDLYWLWTQKVVIESKYRPFWVRMPAGSAVPGGYDVFGGGDRFGASLGYCGDYGGRFGGVGVRRVKK